MTLKYKSLFWCNEKLKSSIAYGADGAAGISWWIYLELWAVLTLFYKYHKPAEELRAADEIVWSCGQLDLFVHFFYSHTFS